MAQTTVMLQVQPAQAIAVQARKAASTGVFRLMDVELDSTAAFELVLYLRDSCKARVVDMTNLGGWHLLSARVAAACAASLRPLRCLVLDGNSIQSSLSAWCKVIEQHPGLQQMSLKRCAIDTDSTLELATALLRSGLFSIELSQNRIEDAGVVALADAASERGLLMDVGVEETDATPLARSLLEQALEGNRAHFGWRCSKSILNTQDLERNGQQPAGAIIAKALRTGADVRRDMPLFHGRGALAARAAASVALEWEASQPEADIGFFDAPSMSSSSVDVTREVLARCRKASLDPLPRPYDEYLYAVCRDIQEAEATRSLERQRGDENLAQITKDHTASQARCKPLVEKVTHLRAELSSASANNELLCVQKLKLTLALAAVQKESEEAEKLADTHVFTATKEESSLRQELRAIAEATSRLQVELHRIEAAADELAADNKSCRAHLHAFRFETEDERFFP